MTTLSSQGSSLLTLAQQTENNPFSLFIAIRSTSEVHQAVGVTAVVVGGGHVQVQAVPEHQTHDIKCMRR